MAIPATEITRDITTSKADHRKSIIMIFDDVFYPQNKAKRQEVANLQAEVRIHFNQFTKQWNFLVAELNEIFKTVTLTKYKGQKFDALQKNIEKDTIEECVNEIKTVVAKTRTLLKEFVEEILPEDIISGLKENWDDDLVIYDPESEMRVRKGLGGAVSLATSIFVVWYLKGGSIYLKLSAKLTVKALGSLGNGIAGFMGGAIIGAAAFVITDIIASAIMGGIEQQRLNESLDALRALKQDVSQPIFDASIQIAIKVQTIQRGVYPLNETHEFRKTSEGEWELWKIEFLKDNNGKPRKTVEILPLTLREAA